MSACLFQMASISPFIIVPNPPPISPPLTKPFIPLTSPSGRITITNITDLPWVMPPPLPPPPPSSHITRMEDDPLPSVWPAAASAVPMSRVPPPPPLPPKPAFGFSHPTLTMGDINSEKMIKCSDCGDSNIITLYKEGRSVCGGCGLVLSNTIIEDGCEWRTFSENREQTQRANHFKDADPDAGLTTVLASLDATPGSRLAQTQQRTSGDDSAKHFAKKQQLRKFMCSVTQLPEDSKDSVIFKAVDLAMRYLSTHPRVKWESVALSALEVSSRMNGKSVHALVEAKSKGVSVHLVQKRFQAMKAMVKDDVSANDTLVALNDDAKHSQKQQTDQKRKDVAVKLQAPSEAESLDQHCLALGLKVPRDYDVIKFMQGRYHGFIGELIGQSTRQPKTQAAAMLLMYWDVVLSYEQPQLRTKTERNSFIQKICTTCDVKEKTLKVVMMKCFRFDLGCFPIRYGEEDHIKLSLPPKLDSKWKQRICLS